MTKKLADVLWKAANKHLSPEDGDTYTQDECSCIAAKIAYYGGCRDIDGYERGEDTPITNYLAGLGCSWYADEMLQFERGPIRQGVRYMWLLLAMHVAEDEGITL